MKHYGTLVTVPNVTLLHYEDTRQGYKTITCFFQRTHAHRLSHWSSTNKKIFFSFGPDGYILCSLTRTNSMSSFHYFSVKLRLWLLQPFSIIFYQFSATLMLPRSLVFEGRFCLEHAMLWVVSLLVR